MPLQVPLQNPHALTISTRSSSLMSAKMMSINTITASSSPPPVKTSITSQPTSLPVRTIPGSYGFPLLGPLADRLDYSWFQGADKFFRKRVEKHQSTVFRTNVPPCFPFLLVNPNVVALVDTKSFAYLFDMEIIDKRNILVGDFMPSTKFTGNRRVCAYLDTSEPQHEQIKNFTMDALKRSSSMWIPTLTSLLDTMWDSIEPQLPNGPVGYFIPIQKFNFAFLSRTIAGADPQNSPDMAENGHIRMDRWLAVQVLPTAPIAIGALQPLADILLHSFPLPYFLVSGDYDKLYEFIETEGKEVVERGQTEFNLTKEDAIHNLLFTLGFNAFGGFTLFFQSLLAALGSEPGVQEKLCKEVREKAGSALSFRSVQEMEFVQSFVYETLRLNPPVALQYGRARKDFELSSHDSVFSVRKGELLCGYQPLVMKDPKVFNDPERFVADRFTKEKGKELLNYLYWSNGPQTGMPGAGNKQCAGKDFVPLAASMFLAHLFLRFDSVTIKDGSFVDVRPKK